MANFTDWLNTLMKDRIDQGKIFITETVVREQRLYGPFSSLDAYPDGLNEAEFEYAREPRHTPSTLWGSNSQHVFEWLKLCGNPEKFD